MCIYVCTCIGKYILTTISENKDFLHELFAVKPNVSIAYIRSYICKSLLGICVYIHVWSIYTFVYICIHKPSYLYTMMHTIYTLYINMYIYTLHIYMITIYDRCFDLVYLTSCTNTNCILIMTQSCLIRKIQKYLINANITS